MLGVPALATEITMKLTEYVQETKAEMAHVTWPSRKQTIGYSVMVILISVGIAAYLGLFDYIFSKLLTLLF
jgi:preprotein translocase subunit SecE